MRPQKVNPTSKVFVFILSAFVASYGHADLQIGAVTSSGMGCPAGTVISSAAPDGSSISLLFESYSGEAGVNGGPLLLRTNCSLLVPVKSSTPVRVSLVAADYRGFVSLEVGGQVRFQSQEAISTNSRDEEDADQREKDFQGPINSDFQFSAERHSGHWTECGTDFQFISQSELLIQSGHSGSQALASIDSLDVALKNGIDFKFQTAPCNLDHGSQGDSNSPDQHQGTHQGDSGNHQGDSGGHQGNNQGDHPGDRGSRQGDSGNHPGDQGGRQGNNQDGHQSGQGDHQAGGDGQGHGINGRGGSQNDNGRGQRPSQGAPASSPTAPSFLRATDSQFSEKSSFAVRSAEHVVEVGSERH